MMVSETSKVRPIVAPFCVGYGIDIGFGGDKVVPHAIGIDQVEPYSQVGTYPVQLGGDARKLVWFNDNSLDFVYSSHLLEDFRNTAEVLEEWARVIRVGGLLILVLPDQQVYVKHCLAGGWIINGHHWKDDFNAAYVKQCAPKNLRLAFDSGVIIDYNFILIFEKMEDGYGS
jgi:predicted SAM-dependent methyltransferase